MPHNAEFAAWLTDQMAATATSPKDLQERTGMGRSAVEGWLKGAVPRFETVNKIAIALGVTPAEAQRVAGHIPGTPVPRQPDEQPGDEADPTPLTAAEVAQLRRFLAVLDMDRVREYGRLVELIGDMTPSAWRRLRALAEALDNGR